MAAQKVNKIWVNRLEREMAISTTLQMWCKGLKAKEESNCEYGDDLCLENEIEKNILA